MLWPSHNLRPVVEMRVSPSGLGIFLRRTDNSPYTVALVWGLNRLFNQIIKIKNKEFF